MTQTAYNIYNNRSLNVEPFNNSQSDSTFSSDRFNNNQFNEYNNESFDINQFNVESFNSKSFYAKSFNAKSKQNKNTTKSTKKKTISKNISSDDETMSDVLSTPNNKQSFVYMAPTSIQSDAVKYFISKFNLYSIMSRPHTDAIYIIPSKSETDSLFKEVNELFSKNSVDKDSDAAAKLQAITPLKFKRYLFDVYDRRMNAVMPYGLKPGIVCARRNRYDEIWYIKQQSNKSILISADDKFENVSEFTEIGKCSNNCYVYSGILDEKINTKKNKADINITGGARSKRDLTKYFKDCVKHFKDVDMAAYAFIGAVTNNNNMRYISNLYSADYLHTAMSIILDNNIPIHSIPAINKLNDKYLNSKHKQLIQLYSPKRLKVDITKAQNALDNIYENTKKMKNKNECNSYFIKAIEKLYGAYGIDTLKADIVTALAKQSLKNISYGIDLVNSIDDIYSGDSSITDSNIVPSIYSALYSAPFIGPVVRQYTPMLMSSVEDEIDYEIENKPFEYAMNDKYSNTTLLDGLKNIMKHNKTCNGDGCENDCENDCENSEVGNKKCDKNNKEVSDDGNMINNEINDEINNNVNNANDTGDENDDVSENSEEFEVFY